MSKYMVIQENGTETRYDTYEEAVSYAFQCALTEKRTVFEAVIKEVDPTYLLVVRRYSDVPLTKKNLISEEIDRYYTLSAAEALAKSIIRSAIYEATEGDDKSYALHQNEDGTEKTFVAAGRVYMNIFIMEE